MTTRGPELPVQPSSSTCRRLVGTLALAGAAAGLLIVVVHVATQPRIQAHRALVLREAVQEVLGAPERTSTLYVLEGGFSEELPEGVDSLTVERVFVGYDAEGQMVGMAISGAEPGFQDIIGLIFGYDPVESRLLGMKVLESKETPGLGDKIEKDTLFVRAFAGVMSPIEGVKRGSGSGDEHQIDLITGATISSRAVIGIINRRLEVLQPFLDEFGSRMAIADGHATGDVNANADADGGGS